MPPLSGQRVAVYARVSTFEQDPENQLQELRRYCEARGWNAVEYVDRGVSGAKDKRPALDALLKDAKRRRFDVLVRWRLDRLGRNLRHLVTMLEDLNHVGVAFVSLGEGIDCTTPAGKLQLHILAALGSSRGNGFGSESWRVWHEFVPRASGWVDRSEPSLRQRSHLSGAADSGSGQAPRRLTCHGASLAVSENPLGIRTPDPLESSTFRGHCSVLPCSINQVISGTVSVGRDCFQCSDVSSSSSRASWQCRGASARRDTYPPPTG